jgi:hypothetical protein
MLEGASTAKLTPNTIKIQSHTNKTPTQKMKLQNMSSKWPIKHKKIKPYQHKINYLIVNIWQTNDKNFKLKKIKEKEF